MYTILILVHSKLCKQDPIDISSKCTGVIHRVWQLDCELIFNAIVKMSDTHRVDYSNRSFIYDVRNSTQSGTITCRLDTKCEKIFKYFCSKYFHYCEWSYWALTSPWKSYNKTYKPIMKLLTIGSYDQVCMLYNYVY